MHQAQKSMKRLMFKNPCLQNCALQLDVMMFLWVRLDTICMHQAQKSMKRLMFKNPCLQNCALQLDVIKNKTKPKISTGSDSTKIRRISTYFDEF